MLTQFKKLHEIADFLSGGTPSRKIPEYFQGSIPWITGNDVVDFRTTRGRECITEEAIKNSATHLVPKGSTLFVTRTGVGKVSIADVDICISQDLTGVVPKDGVDAEYLARYLRSIGDQLRCQQRGTTILGITREMVEQIDVPLPPLPIQKRIVAILEKADAAQEKRRKANELTEHFLQSAFLEMFGDPVTNPKGWEMKDLASISSSEKNSIKAGPFGSSLKKESYVERGFKVYGQEQVIRDDLSLGNYFISQEKFHELEAYRIRAGDILISLVGTYGRISIVPRDHIPGIINPRLMKITLNQTVMVPIVLKHILQSEAMKAMMKNKSHGGTMDIMNVSLMKELKCYSPPIKLQHKFALLVQKVAELTAKQERSGTELDNLFGSLTQVAFGGELVA